MTPQYIIYKKVRNFIEQADLIQVVKFPLLSLYRTMYDRLDKSPKNEIDIAIYEYNVLLNYFLVSSIERIMALPNPQYIAYLLPIEIVHIAFSQDLQISEPYQIIQS